MIKFIEASKDYGPNRAVRLLNLELERGKTHIFLGSSGCGKSTLLKLICGLTSLSRGKMLINGHIVVGQRPPACGYVIQEGGLFPHLTAEKNISLAASAKGWDRLRIKNRLMDLSQLVKIESSLLKKYPQQLSGGQRQRISLMRALMLDPELLLLDEPLGALDPLVRSHLQLELKDIFFRLKKTVVFVTHDVNEGALLGDTISLFDQGLLLQHGSFQDLIRRPASSFVSDFLKAQLPSKEFLEIL